MKPFGENLPRRNKPFRDLNRNPFRVIVFTKLFMFPFRGLLKKGLKDFLQNFELFSEVVNQ